jgi:hypothetical protein
MRYITAIWRALTGRPRPAVELGPTPRDLRALYVPAPRRSRPQLAARWEVQGLFPDATGRPTPRLGARWEVQEPGTPAWDDARAPGTAAPRQSDAASVGEAMAS